MCGVLVHRGPDGDGTWHDTSLSRPVWFGFRRLAVLDLEGGAQPMKTEDGRFVIVYNGEIYNFEDLRRELQQSGVRFATDHSDTESLLKAYAHWELGTMHRLSGMFAFAVLDRREQKLVLARDRFGKKPLFYTQTSNGLVFGSELAAVLAHTGVEKVWSRTSLARYLALGYLPAPRTLFRGVKKLPGGHTLIYDLRTGAIEVRKFWEYRIDPRATPSGDTEAWEEELRELLDRAVRRRLRADVPLGFFLSGGIDSTAVVAFAKRHVEKKRLLTFNVGFEEPSFDESSYARLVAERYGTRHHETTLNLHSAVELLPDLLARMDEPIADPSLLPTYILSRFASERVTVALCGDGGDELFAGYDPFRALRMARLYEAIMPRFAHKLVGALVDRFPISGRNMSLDFKLRRALRGLSYPRSVWNPVWLAPATPTELATLFGRPFSVEDLYPEAIQAWHSCESSDIVDRTLEFFARFYLSENLLTKMDRASMLCSLEVRSPFLDNDLVDYVTRLPAAVKYRGGKGKWLLRRALTGLVPREIVDRPKKGFGIPLVPLLKKLPDPDLGLAADLGLDPATLGRWWREQRDGTHDHRGVLWAWLTIQYNARRYTVGAVA